MLKIFEDIDKIKEKHPKYTFLKNRVWERKVLENLVDGFVDRDNDITFKFQKEFHSSFWEFYLFGLFKELGFEVDFSKNRPDFIIKNPLKINIEAVTANVKNDGSDAEGRTFLDTYPLKLSDLEFKKILDEGIVRNSNALNNKMNSFKKNYSRCNWIDEKDPFIIAIGAYDQTNYGREFYFSMLALLYGYYATKYEVGANMTFKESILKPGTNSEIQLNLFSNEEYSDISAIIFSCTATIGKLSALSISRYGHGNSVISIRHDSEYNNYPIHDVSINNPEEIGDGLFIFHNPNAKVSIEKSLFNKIGIVQIYIEDCQLKIMGDNLPLLSRYNSDLMESFPNLV